MRTQAQTDKESIYNTQSTIHRMNTSALPPIVFGVIKRLDTALSNDAVSPCRRPEPLNQNSFFNVQELDSDESPQLLPTPLKPTMNRIVPRDGKKKEPRHRRVLLQKGRMNEDLRSCVELGGYGQKEHRKNQLFQTQIKSQLSRAASPMTTQVDHMNLETQLSRNSDHSNNSRKMLISKLRDAKVRVTSTPPCTISTKAETEMDTERGNVTAEPPSRTILGENRRAPCD